MPRVVRVREAAPADLNLILPIYNEIVANTTAIYSDLPTVIEERRAWLKDHIAIGLPVTVAHDGADILGFASLSTFRSWPGYRHTVEHSVHVKVNERGQGVGRLLLSDLIERARALGKHAMIGGIDSHNHASLSLHAKFGFTKVGELSQVARKFNRWLDLVLVELLL